MRITNLQKKELSELFKQAGLSLMDFTTSGQHRDFVVKFKYEYFSFSISIQHPNSFRLTIFAIDNTNGYTVTDTWDGAKARFRTWASQIASELDTPTGWETFESTNYLNADFKDLNEKFTPEDRNRTIASINDLKERISTLDLPGPKLEVIQRKLDELALKIDELSKFDWKSLFIGTFASLMMTLALPPDVNGIIWEYIRIAFSSFHLPI